MRLHHMQLKIRISKIDSNKNSSQKYCQKIKHKTSWYKVVYDKNCVTPIIYIYIYISRLTLLKSCKFLLRFKSLTKI